MSAAPLPPSIWAAVTPPHETSAPLVGDDTADVAVIGGGFTGLSTALHLARRGVSVTLLEANEAGWGASGRNNGQVIPTLTAAEPDAIIAKHGETGERFVKLIGESAAYLFDTARAEAIDAEAEQNGWFQPAHSPGRVKLSQKRVEAWQRHGFPAELYDREQTRALLGSDYWYGGMFNPTGGHINPLALARGLATAAQRHGATIYEGTPALSYRRERGGWVVETAKGTLKARALVLATNAYTGLIAQKLAPRLARTFVPILSWQMSTEPIGDNLRGTILPGRQAVSDTRGDLFFFRYDARNRLITGGAVLGPWNKAERVKAKQAKRIAEAFPDLGEPRITHAWSGHLSVTWNRFPRVHQLGQDAWTWVGCNGRGVALSVSLGRELAAVVSGVPADELALPVSGIAPLPAHAVGRRVAPYYLGWLKRKDRREPAL